MSLSDFYDAEMWEVTAVLKTYFLEKEKEFRHGYEIARFQMSSMIDTKSIKFPWELSSRTIEDLTDQEIEAANEAKKILDARAKNEYKAKEILLGMGYSKLKAAELILTSGSTSKKVIEVNDLVNIAING
jgi:hypothetical protein